MTDWRHILFIQQVTPEGRDVPPFITPLQRQFMTHKTQQKLAPGWAWCPKQESLGQMEQVVLQASKHRICSKKNDIKNSK